MASNGLYKDIRIRFIHNFLMNGGGSLKKMMDFVIEQSREPGIPEIKERMFKNHISDFRKGEFTHQNEDPKLKGKAFQILYKNQIYKYDPKSRKPQFGDLSEEERLSLPFLLVILKPYENIPAVEKVLNDLVKRFELDQLELNSAKAIVIQKPVLVNEKKVISLAIKILGHIQRQECIEFGYSEVNKLNAFKDFTIRKVVPLLIRIYENIYYLTGVTEKKGSEILVNYRIDMIDRFKVDVMRDENTDAIINFKYDDYHKKFNLNNRFKDTLGIWIHETTDPLEKVRIRFNGWAASYVKSLPLHKSQIIHEKDIDFKNNTLVAEIQIQLYPQREPKVLANDRSQELAFLLGRFGKDCEVLKNN